MSTNDITVRPATIEDAAGIARVHVASWQFAYRGVVPDEVLDNLSVARRTTFWEHGVTHSLPRATTLVAVRESQVVGFCNCGPALSSDAPEHLGEVAAIYVDPGSSRQGVGRRLMDAALAHLAREGFTEAILWVLEDNPIGRSFYEGYGWNPTDITKVEAMGGIEVTEVQYRIDLPPNSSR